MLEEALTKIQELADEASAVQITEIPGDKRRRILQQRGEHEFLDIPPPPRNHAVESIADLAELSRRFQSSQVVWVSKEKIVLVIDDADRRDTAAITLAPSPIFARLSQLRVAPGNQAPRFSQRDLLRLLNVDLAAGFSGGPLIQTIRGVKFRAGTMASADLQHSRESLGRELDNEVICAGDLPDRFTVTGPVFSNADLADATAEFSVSLEVDFEQQKFIVEVFPGQIETNVDWAMGVIVDRLGGENFAESTAILRGTP